MWFRQASYPKSCGLALNRKLSAALNRKLSTANAKTPSLNADLLFGQASELLIEVHKPGHGQERLEPVLHYQVHRLPRPQTYTHTHTQSYNHTHALDQSG